MIKVFLRGGLGNQMFQYAFGLALAEQTGEKLYLDTVFLNDRLPRREFTPRKFDLDVFSLETPLMPLSRVSERMPVPGVWLGLDFIWSYIKDILGTETFLRERNEHIFDPAVLKIKGNVTTWGYWQNEKYFEGIENQLRSTFRFRHPLTGEAKELEEKIRASESVSLHVRRGDYQKFKSLSTTMGQINLEYYNNAVAYLSQKVSRPNFFIFSDDIEWCRKNIKLDFPVTYASPGSAGPKAAFHLELMSLCTHNIIANSTFSWWGAWLNKHSAKIVIAPRKWYGDNKPSDGIVPDRWIKL